MQEIFGWNETMKTSPKSRPVRDGHRQTATEFGLSEKQILTIERLARDGQVQHCKSVRSHLLQDQLCGEPPAPSSSQRGRVQVRHSR
jgi:hypothetical protein